MKMIILLLLAISFACILWGCGSLLRTANGPQLGEYEYTHRVEYKGDVVREIPIWIDVGFGEGDRVAIMDAINAWNYVLNGHIVLKVVDIKFDMEVDKIVKQVQENGWLIMKIGSLSSLVPDNDEGYWTIGFTERLGGNHLYLVRDRLGNDDVFGVTLHEIGHLLGAGHVGERLMYPHFSRAGFQCVDWVSMEAVARYQGLDDKDLNYCMDSGTEVNAKGPLL